MDHASLSPIAMFVNAGSVGKLVMLILIIAMIWTWFLITKGLLAIRRMNKALSSAKLSEQIDILESLATVSQNASLVNLPDETISQKRDRIAERMSRAARESLTLAEGGLSNLAIISSVAPFIGLFGTVWGIMTSFAGIAQSQDTSLAVVAPGIAEALAATAFGLAAAIPASIGYNRIGASFARIGQEISGYIEEKSLQIVKEEADKI